MTITQWPLQERPREKLIERGAAALSDAELLAIILRTGTRGRTAVDIARETLIKHGSLRALFNASLAEITDISGLSSNTFAHLQAVKELGKRYIQENLPKENLLKHLPATKHYIQTKLQDYTHEVFACLFLDTHYRLIKFCELFQGTINQAIVHPREIVKKCLYYNATAVIIAHNHPSGDTHPSLADLDLTQRIKNALALIDIRLLDHIIVSPKKATSCAELGYL